MARVSPFLLLRHANEQTHGDDFHGKCAVFDEPDMMTTEIMKHTDDLPDQLKRLEDSEQIGKEANCGVQFYGYDTEGYPRFPPESRGTFRYRDCFWKFCKMHLLRTQDEYADPDMEDIRLRNTRRCEPDGSERQPPAIIQLSTETRCLIIPLILFCEQVERPMLPDILCNFLTDRNKVFLGVGIKADLDKVADWFYNVKKMDAKNFIKLQNIDALYKLLHAAGLGQWPNLANFCKVCDDIPIKIKYRAPHLEVAHCIFNWFWPSLSLIQLLYATRDAAAPVKILRFLIVKMNLDIVKCVKRTLGVTVARCAKRRKQSLQISSSTPKKYRSLDYKEDTERYIHTSSTTYGTDGFPTDAMSMDDRRARDEARAREEAAVSMYATDPNQYKHSEARMIATNAVPASNLATDTTGLANGTCTVQIDEIDDQLMDDESSVISVESEFGEGTCDIDDFDLENDDSDYELENDDSGYSSVSARASVASTSDSKDEASVCALPAPVQDGSIPSGNPITANPIVSTAEQCYDNCPFWQRNMSNYASDSENDELYPAWSYLKVYNLERRVGRKLQFTETYLRQNPAVAVLRRYTNEFRTILKKKGIRYQKHVKYNKERGTGPYPGVFSLYQRGKVVVYAKFKDSANRDRAIEELHRNEKDADAVALAVPVDDNKAFRGNIGLEGVPPTVYHNPSFCKDDIVLRVTCFCEEASTRDVAECLALLGVDGSWLPGVSAYRQADTLFFQIPCNGLAQIATHRSEHVHLYGHMVPVDRSSKRKMELHRSAFNERSNDFVRIDPSHDDCANHDDD